MSICPDKSIFSLYIDNELAQPLRRKFENHVSTCENCTKYLQLYSSAQHDLKSLNVSYDEDEGFKRLKTRMSYKAYVSPQRFSFPAFLTRLTPAVAAVAILAVFVPVVTLFSNNGNAVQYTSGITTNMVSPQVLLPPADISNIAPMQEKGVVFEEKLTLCRIDSAEAKLYTVSVDAKKFTDIDVFKPAVLKNDSPIDIILFDSPAVVLHQTDDFGFSNPVFLLRE